MEKVEITKEKCGWILSVCYDEYLEVPIENSDEMRQIAQVLINKADEIDDMAARTKQFQGRVDCQRQYYKSKRG